MLKQQPLLLRRLPSIAPASIPGDTVETPHCSASLPLQRPTSVTAKLVRHLCYGKPERTPLKPAHAAAAAPSALFPSTPSDFNADAAECSEGLCDELSLEANGPLYLVPNAAVRGQPEVQGDLQCFLDTLSALDGVNLPRTDGRSDRRSLNPADFAYLLPMNPHTNITELVATRNPNIAQVWG